MNSASMIAENFIERAFINKQLEFQKSNEKEIIPKNDLIKPSD